MLPELLVLNGYQLNKTSEKATDGRTREGVRSRTLRLCKSYIRTDIVVPWKPTRNGTPVIGCSKRYPPVIRRHRYERCITTLS